MVDERDPMWLNVTRRLMPGPLLRRVAPSARVRERATSRAYAEVEAIGGRGEALPRDAGGVTVREVMTRAVEALSPADPASRAAERMNHGRYHHVPVVDAESRLVGLVTLGDLARLMMRDPLGWREVPLRNFMTTAVTTVEPHIALRDAAQRLITTGHTGAPVVDPLGRPVGFLSARDVLHVLVRRAPLRLWV